MKRVLSLFVALCAIASIQFGCGGGGGGGGVGGGGTSGVEATVRALFTDVNQEDLNGTMSHFSDNYLNDCFDWVDVRNEFEDIFNTPNYSEDWIDLDITFSEVDGDFGYAEGTFVIRTNDNGVITEDPYDFAWDFIREDGRWKLIGNQQCNLAPAQKDAAEPTKRFWLKGSARKK
jgi:ketosteroid isomerase-like protein